jgi:hypothetical protein
MFIVSCFMVCGGLILYFLTLLQYRNPKKTFLKRHPSSEIYLTLLIITLFLFGSIGVFVDPISMPDLVWAAITVAATVVILKFMKLKDRLAAYAAEEKSGLVIVGDFTPTTPANKPLPTYRKAA